MYIVHISSQNSTHAFVNLHHRRSSEHAIAISDFQSIA